MVAAATTVGSEPATDTPAVTAAADASAASETRCSHTSATV